MRRGEILGLRWCDLDLDAGRLSVRQALVSIAYDVQLSDVKTGTGRRTIDLDPGTVDVMKAWRIERAEERDGFEPADDDLVFCEPDGSWIHPHSFSQILDRKVAKLDVPDLSLLDLRHTHATLLLKAGVPAKVVGERLGHANVAVTMSIYQHVLPGMQGRGRVGVRRHRCETRQPAVTRGVTSVRRPGRADGVGGKLAQRPDAASTTLWSWPRACTPTRSR